MQHVTIRLAYDYETRKMTSDCMPKHLPSFKCPYLEEEVMS